jgi:hypothetical protein
MGGRFSYCLVGAAAHTNNNNNNKITMGHQKEEELQQKRRRRRRERGGRAVLYRCQAVGKSQAGKTLTSPRSSDA